MYQSGFQLGVEYFFLATFFCLKTHHFPNDKLERELKLISVCLHALSMFCACSICFTLRCLAHVLLSMSSGQAISLCLRTTLTQKVKSMLLIRLTTKRIIATRCSQKSEHAGVEKHRLKVFQRQLSPWSNKIEKGSSTYIMHYIIQVTKSAPNP